MNYVSNPWDMTPEERLEEVAEILAQGFMRVSRRPDTTICQSQEAADDEVSDAGNSPECQRKETSPSGEN